MKLIVNMLCVCIICLGCQSNESITDNSSSATHLKYFGFTLVDTFWDDPLDSASKSNYLDEVASFSNIADLLVLQPTDDIRARLSLMDAHHVKAILHISELFFENVSDGGTSGTIYNLRDDYRQRWDTFIRTNDLNTIQSMVEVFYLGEEPTWNSISYEELKLAADYIKVTIPDIPVMLVEAYPILDQLKVPNSINWVGFDHYFIKDPKNDATFLNELAILKSKLVNEEQKLVLILDSHYIKEVHGDFAGIQKEDMKDVATSYYELALSEYKVIALIGYTWPGGFDSPEALGARQLSQETQNEYSRIGKEITGKQ